MTRALALGALGAVVVWAALAATAAQAQPGAAEKPPDPEDILRHFVVTATATKPLPKIAVQPSLASNIEDVTIRSVIRRDLDLCGEFEVLPDEAAPDGLYLSDTPVDVKAWASKGADAVVKVSGQRLPSGKVELRGVAYFVDTGDQPVFQKRYVVDGTDVRADSHRVADALIGALTGTPGGFASQMTFIFGSGISRRVYVMDADGHNPRPVSSSDRIALSPAFGPNQQLHYAASINHGPYRVFTLQQPHPLPIIPSGSVYGLAFSPQRDQVAVSIAVKQTIQVFTGPDLGHLRLASPVGLALHPAFTPSGKLAFAGEGRWGQQVYLDGRAISPAGLNASAPVFCRHPEGVRLVYAVGVGKNTDLVVSTEQGQGLGRLTQNQGRNGYPACSPDGRLIAFFSTRHSNEGPGLYIMRIDGQRPKRVSTLVGDSLRWARLPSQQQGR